MTNFFETYIDSHIKITLLCIASFLTFFTLSNELTHNLNIGSRIDYSKEVWSRIEALKNQDFNLSSEVPRPFVRMKSHYRMAPQYKISGCIVEKAMCTVLQGFMCYLYDTDGFIKNNKSITKDIWEERFCMDRNEAKFAIDKHLAMPFEHDTLFVIRDPIQRFLSGFVNKCYDDKTYCYGCNQDVLCAVEGLYKEVMNISATHWDVSKSLNYYIYPSFETQHMAPQTWYCDLFDEGGNYSYLKYGDDRESDISMKEELYSFLGKHGVEPQKLDYIRTSLSGNYGSNQNRAQHSTKFSNHRQEIQQKLMSSEKHLKLLMKIFKYDYIVFGFTPPIPLE